MWYNLPVSGFGSDKFTSVQEHEAAINAALDALYQQSIAIGGEAAFQERLALMIAQATIAAQAAAAAQASANTVTQVAPMIGQAIGNGSSATFTIPLTLITKQQVMIFIDSVYQSVERYEIGLSGANTIVTFSVPFPSGAVVDWLAQPSREIGALNASNALFPFGSAALPSMTFSTDNDTGLYRAAANQLGASTQGVMRWLLSNTAFQINVPVTGSAVTANAADTASGKLMRTGDCGWGQLSAGNDDSLFGGDCDNVRTPGMWRMSGSSLNRPAAGGQYAVFVVRDGVSGRCHQFAFRGNSLEIYFRAFSGSVWTDWEPIHARAYGLGTAIQLTSADNLDNLTVSGFYYNPTGGNAAGNNYPITSAGSLQVIRETSTRHTQRFSAFVPGALATQVRVFERSLGTAGWSPWVEIFHQGSILRAVNQSGGVPTGGLRENVSNANGRAERDFSGSMECWRENLSAANASTALGSRFRSADVTWTFPSSFLAGSTPVVTPSVIDADCDVRVVSVSPTQAVFRVISDISKASAITIQARAKGRWSDMT